MVHYKTGKLPPNFVFLGILLLGIGIWRMIVLDWVGVLLFLLGVLAFFTHSGLSIDGKAKRLRKYIRIYGFKAGPWQDIPGLMNLRISRARFSQTMHIRAATTTTTEGVYKLHLVLQTGILELLQGKKDWILQKAEEIAEELHTSIDYNLL